jgi:protein tyrosine phosphatase (PTP) superfamily phosphohydrolase (DUF442 family)
MSQARRFNQRITIGEIPSNGDLEQLARDGYRTVVDLRDATDGPLVQRAGALGLDFVHVPVRCKAITVDELSDFFTTVYSKGCAPLYIFSHTTSCPLVLLVLFEGVGRKEPLSRIHRRAARLGVDFVSYPHLWTFLAEFHSDRSLEPVVVSLHEQRPDLFAA